MVRYHRSSPSEFKGQLAPWPGKAPGESEKCFSTGPHTDGKNTGPIVDSRGGEDSSPALALLYFLLFSVHRTDQATGQPQQSLKCPWNKELSAEYNAPPHPNSGCTCSLRLRVATSFPTEIAAVLLASGTTLSPLGWSLAGHLALTSVSGPISKAIKDVWSGCLALW